MLLIGKSNMIPKMNCPVSGFMNSPQNLMLEGLQQIPFRHYILDYIFLNIYKTYLLEMALFYG